MALTFVVLGLPVFDTPVKTAKAAEAAETETIYVLTTTMTDGGNYLIVSRGTAGSGNAFTRYNTTSYHNQQVTVLDGAAEENAAYYQTTEGKPFIKASDVAAGSIWATDTKVTDDGSSMRLSNDGYYLQVEGANNAITITQGSQDEQTSSRYHHFSWSYLSTYQLKLEYHSDNGGGGDRIRYLIYNSDANSFSGFNGANTEPSSDQSVYIYAERTVITHTHTYAVDHTDWTVGDVSAAATVTYKCGECGDTVAVVADVTRTEIPGTCDTAPQWKYTATISSAKSPSGESFSAEKTVVQRIVDPDSTASKKIYVLVDSIQLNRNYLIVTANEEGPGHALANGNPAICSNGQDIAVKDRAVEIKTGEVTIFGNTTVKTYIETAESDSVWRYSRGYQYPAWHYCFSNGGYYIFHYSGTSPDGTNINIAYLSQTGEYRYRGWTVGSDTIRYIGSENSYYLVYNANSSNPWETLGKVANSAAAPGHTYIFEEVSSATVHNYKDAEPLGHQSPLAEVLAKDATCEEAGNIHHYKCERCGTLFSDANGQNVISANDVVIPAAHDWKFDEDSVEWVGNNADGYTAAKFNYTCSRNSGHTIDPIEVTVTPEEIAATTTSCAKTVYTATVSAEDSYDHAAHTVTKTVNKYLITFVNDDDDNTVLQSGLVAEGVTPVYSGAAPAKIDSTGQYTYTFSDWDEEIIPANGDKTYTATYTAETNQYTIKFVDNDEAATELFSNSFAFGSTPACDPDKYPTKEPNEANVFPFDGWVDQTGTFYKIGVDSLPTVEGPATYTAHYDIQDRTYTVTFVDDEGNLITEVDVVYANVPDYTTIPTKDPVGDAIFEFAGWKDNSEQPVIYGATYLPAIYSEGVVFTAVFTAKYPINIGTIIDGTMVVEGDASELPRASEGELVTLTLTPEDGYQYHDGSIKVVCGSDEIDVIQTYDNQFEFYMPAGGVEITAACEHFYNVCVNGKWISTLTASDVLHDAENGASPRMTYSEDDEQMVLTILTSDTIVLNSTNGSNVMIDVNDSESSRKFVINAPNGFSLESDTACFGILSTNDITINGDATIKGNEEFFYGVSSYNCASITINGNLTLESAEDADGQGLSTDGAITINGDVNITVGGINAIYTGNNLLIKASTVVVEGSYCGISAFAADIDGDVTISVVGTAINVSDTLSINGDLFVTNNSEEYLNAVDVNGFCMISGDVTLEIGGLGNGILAQSIEISGDVTGTNSYEGDAGVLLYSLDGDITVRGSVRAENKNGVLIWACCDEESTSEASVTIVGNVTGLEDNLPAICSGGILANNDLTIDGDVIMQVSNWVNGGSALRASNGGLVITGNLDLTFYGFGLYADGDINLKGDVNMESSDALDGDGILSYGTIIMDGGVWTIKMQSGQALYADGGITIPETHGVSIPENGEIGAPEGADFYTVLLDGAPGQNNVRIEPFVTVTFVNDDGETLQTVKSYPGQSPKYTEDEPTKESTAQKVFTFKGWKDDSTEYDKDEDLPEIAEDSDALTYTAVYEETTRKYTIKFVNGTEELQSSDVAYGETPAYNGDEPTKEADAQYTYTFSGWDPEISAVTGEATYTAQFDKTVNKYKVTFVDENGTVLKEAVEYDYGTKAADIAKPADPTKAATAEKTFGFGGWTPEISDVTGNVTYKATYVDANAKYKVTFVDEDGTVLKEAVEYDYGTKAANIAKPADPTKAEDEKYTYKFSGWTPEISDVINDATYKATYEKTEKKVEKGVYKYIGEAAKYTKGSKKAVTIIFKRTENDEITFDMFAGVKTAKGDLTSGKHYTAKKGSVEITLLPEYLETLEVGKTAITVSFQDGDPVTIELEVVAAQQQADTNPTTGDSLNMNYIWIILALGAAALAIVIFVQIKRRREEEF